LNVLLFRAGALGDLLLLRPTIARLRAAGHRVVLLAPAGVGAVLCGPGAAESALPADGVELASALADGFASGPIARALDAADLVVAYSRSPSLIERLAERARRLIVHDPAPPASGPHAARWLEQAIAPLVGALPEATTPAAGLLTFTDAEQREADGRIRSLPPRFLAVHPGSGSPGKNWPLDRFAAAAGRLAGEEPWLLVQGPAEESLVAPAQALVAREWPLRVLGAALARAGLFIGNDSGVTHLAAAAGAPTLALFGPTDPGLWAPLGPRVTILPAAAGRIALTVDEVVEAGARLRSAASALPSG
jgi:ADP-heptose:LPS heptosyltransferase